MTVRPYDVTFCGWKGLAGLGYDPGNSPSPRMKLEMMDSGTLTQSLSQYMKE